MLRIPRQLRWAAPVGALAVVTAVVAGSLAGVAQAAPSLPARTPAQLLAAAAGSTAPPALTGTVVETASLGIPQLPGAGNPTSITSLLAGSHTVKVWYADPTHVRLAALATLGETDVIRNGSTGWLWQSRTNSAVRYQLPARPGTRPKAPVPGHSPLTPQQAARQVLSAVGHSTRVSLERNVMIAGHPAYQLVVRPRSGKSLIGKVTIALDGRHPQVPLRVQVFPRGSASPAFQVGYTALSFVTPAAANFHFTPPHGASVRTVTPGSHAGPKAGGTPPHGAGGYWSGQPPTGPGRPPAAENGAKVVGSGWLSVAVLPASSLSAVMGTGNAAGVAGQAARSAAGAGGSVNPGAVLGALMKAATPVHGSWGSGRLLRTRLLSILITSKGQVLAGAVTPPVLYAAAAKTK